VRSSAASSGIQPPTLDEVEKLLRANVEEISELEV